MALVLVAAALTGPGSVSVTTLSAAAGPTPPPVVTEAPDQHQALLAAKRQGTPVEVAGMKTEHARFFANPSGTTTMEQSPVPERIKRGGQWVTLDPTLEKRPGGTFAPKAATTEVAFSGGGTGAFARLTAGDTELALTWPAPLPEPTITGNTATYPEVLSGVDLRARANREGLAHELVVKTKEAAADPALTKITFGVTAKGLKLSTDQAGNFTAANAEGKPVFRAPTATMWDSGAQDKRKTARVGVHVSQTELNLLPDKALLADPNAVLPIVVDPTYSWHTPWVNGWVLVRSHWADTPHWNIPADDQDEKDQGVGRLGMSPDDGHNSIDRMFFQFDTRILADAWIKSATFNIKQSWKWYHTCDVNDPVHEVEYMDLHWTGEIDAGTTWNNMPPMFEKNLIGWNRAVGKVGHCAPEWVGFNIYDLTQRFANSHWPYMTLGLKDDKEAGHEGWKRFFVQTENDGAFTYPRLRVEYNHAPSNAYGHRTDPVLAEPCANCAGKSFVGTDRIILSGVVDDTDGGTVRAAFETFNDARLPRFQLTDWLPAGSRLASAYDLSDEDGREIRWHLWGGDGERESHVRVAGRPFTVDLKKPERGPTVASKLYQPDNDWHGGTGVSDTFTFTANGVEDIDRYEYSFTDPPSTSLNANGLGGNATVTLTPPDNNGGPVTLFVRSVDRAGHASDVTKYIFRVRPGTGPKAHWALDGNTNDEAYLGDRDATLHGGATWTSAGAVGSASQLNGSTAYLSARNTVRTDASFTVSAWVNLRQAGENATAVSQLGNLFPGFSLSYLKDGQRWAFGMGKSDTANLGADYAQSEPGAPQPGQWTHLAGVYDAPGGVMRLYVNGELKATTPRAPSWNSTGEVRIGHTVWNGVAAAEKWDGAVDEVRIHDRTLSTLDLRTLIGRDNVQVGHWKFTEAENVTVRNSVAGGPNLTLRNGAALTPDGAAGKGLALDGTDDFAATDSQVVRTDDSFTATAWVRLDSAAAEGKAFTALSQDGEKRSGFTLGHRQVNNESRWEAFAPAGEDAPGGAQVISSMPAKPGVPTHLAVVHDRQAQQIRLYVDGVLAGSAEWKNVFTTSGSLGVGRAKWNGVPANHWPGMVDEVRAYSRALDMAEIRGIVTGDDVSVGSWKLDGTAADNSGRRLDGTLNGGPTWIPGQTFTPNTADKAVNLDGVDDHIAVPRALDTPRSFAVSAWLKPDQANKTFTAVSQDGARGSVVGTPARSGFALQTTADGKFAFAVTGGLTELSTAKVTGGIVQTTVWTHVTGVHDADRKQITLYVNGLPVGTTSLQSAAPAGGGLLIGRGQFDGKPVEFYDGGIDDVRLYQRGLFEEEIRTMAGRDLALVHHLKADETGGTEAGDSLGGRPGTLEGGASFVPGRSGNAVSLNGTDGAVRTDGLTVRTDQNFTVSAWVNLKAAGGRATAVSLDSGTGSKFRLGHVKDEADNKYGTWVFEMPESDGKITKAAVSVLPTQVGEDAWTHLTGTYDASTRRLTLYVNGLNVGDGNLRTAWQGTEGLQLGRARIAGKYQRYWPGRIDDVRVFTGDIGRDRVEELYTSYGPA